jgi:hypothetical protein
MRSRFLVRLNSNGDDIGAMTDENVGEQCLCRLFEVHPDFRQTARKTLPIPDVHALQAHFDSNCGASARGFCCVGNRFVGTILTTLTNLK